MGVVWNKVATVLDAGLTVEKSNKAFNDRQEMLDWDAVKTNYTF